MEGMIVACKMSQIMLRIRSARVSDAPAICELVNYYAERGCMLHRSLESVYEALREFHVAEDEKANIVGCVALDVFWADLAEIKSLAVAPAWRGRGVGSRLMHAALADAKNLGLRKVFALTYEKEFFAKHGFEIVERSSLPEKVWRECLACPKADACDEIAMIRILDDSNRTGRPTQPGGDD